jgi:hypothetical protein
VKQGTIKNGSYRYGCLFWLYSPIIWFECGWRWGLVPPLNNNSSCDTVLPLFLPFVSLRSSFTSAGRYRRFFRPIIFPSLLCTGLPVNRGTNVKTI